LKNSPQLAGSNGLHYAFLGVWLLGRCVAVVGMSPWHYWHGTITTSLTITLTLRQPLSNDTFHI